MRILVLSSEETLILKSNHAKYDHYRAPIDESVTLMSLA